ncbi:hypothetical protein EAE99_008617 [Botrytis elliptica]|nr:hypothetical protein EAE99_008617 [Botrytis elliptica]
MPSFTPFTRYDVSLNTGSGDGSNKNYYDQVCAISQKTINENFVQLFNQREGLKQISYSTPTELGGGLLEASLLPPQVRVAFSGDSTPEFLYEIHINEGYITWSPQRSIKIDGWVITVKATLEDMAVTPQDDDDEDQEALRIDAMRELKKNYKINSKSKGLKAGDYSIQRLFVAFSESSWQSPNDEHTYVPDPKSPKDAPKLVKLRDLRASTEREHYIFRLLAKDAIKVLGYWAESRQHTAYFTLGVQVRLPLSETKEAKKRATFTPYAVSLQAYPYFTTEDQVKQMNQDGTLQGKPGHDYNCILWCETVQQMIDGQLYHRRLPEPRKINYSGNLAEAPTPNSSVDVEKTGMPGTFILDHRLFLEQRILKPLQELCVATNLIPMRPKLWVSNGTQMFTSRLAIGVDPDPAEIADSGNEWRGSLYPEDVPKQDPASEWFQFKPDGPNRYKWEKTIHAPGSEDVTHTFRSCSGAPVWRRWKINSTNSVVVSWESGGDTFHVKGSTSYDHWEAWSGQTSKFMWGSYGSECYRGDFKITADWGFSIKLKVPQPNLSIVNETENTNGMIQPVLILVNKTEDKNGMIQPEVILKNNKLPPIKTKRSGGLYVRDKTDENFETQINKNFSTRLEIAIEKLKAGFAGNGCFTYPGTRTLLFGDPTINKRGDIMCVLRYKELEKDLVTIIPPSLNQIPDSVSQTGKTIGTVPMVNKNQPHISWATSQLKSYDPVKKRAVLILEGRNISETRMSFEKFQVVFLLQNKETGLYYREDWAKKPEGTDWFNDACDAVSTLKGKIGELVVHGGKDSSTATIGASFAQDVEVGTSQKTKANMGIRTEIITSGEDDSKFSESVSSRTEAISYASDSKPKVTTPSALVDGPSNTTAATVAESIKTTQSQPEDVTLFPETTHQPELAAPGSFAKKQSETTSAVTEPLVPIGQPTGKPTDPQLFQSAEKPIIQAVDSATVAQPPASAPDLSVKPKPKMKVSAPSETWALTKDRVSKELAVSFTLVDNKFPQFEISPKVGKVTARAAKFAMISDKDDKSFICLELDGSVASAGTYIVQITEYYDDITKEEGLVVAHTFLKVLCQAGGGGSADVVTQEEFDQLSRTDAIEK